jgi:hypothetical protein
VEKRGCVASEMIEMKIISISMDVSNISNYIFYFSV